MPRYAAAIERKSRIAERQMKRVPDEIMNKKGMPRDAQGFRGKMNEFIRLEMMDK